MAPFDEVWMPAIANRGLVVIGRDKRIRTRPVEIDAIRTHGLRVFRIGGKHDQSTWEWLSRLVRNWNRMEQVIASRPVGPWFYLINENGLAEVKLERPSAAVVTRSTASRSQSKRRREPDDATLTGLELEG